MVRFKESEPDTVNTNEIITDYDFYFQIVCEDRQLDFDSEV